MRLWIGRILIGLVLFINLQSAIAFIWTPQAYAHGLELQGTVGNATMRGFGVLFLMWNVPYAVAVLNPHKYRISLYEAIAMQAIGLFGESILIWTLPSEHLVLRSSVRRFIVFDGAGLVLLLLSTWITRLPESIDAHLRD